MWMQSCFKSGFWNAKKKKLDLDSRRKPDSRTGECKALSERDLCVCILKMRAEAMHKRMGQSVRTDCVVGAKYYLAVHRSWLWLGRLLQCMWTQVVQITIPITFWIVIRNVFRNVLLAHVNTANDALLRTRRALSLYKVYGDSALLVLNGTSWNMLTPLWFSTRWYVPSGIWMRPSNYKSSLQTTTAKVLLHLPNNTPTIHWWKIILRNLITNVIVINWEIINIPPGISKLTAAWKWITESVDDNYKW